MLLSEPPKRRVTHHDLRSDRNLQNRIKKGSLPQDARLKLRLPCEPRSLMSTRLLPQIVAWSPLSVPSSNGEEISRHLPLPPPDRTAARKDRALVSVAQSKQNRLKEAAGIRTSPFFLFFLDFVDRAARNVDRIAQPRTILPFLLGKVWGRVTTTDFASRVLFPLVVAMTPPEELNSLMHWMFSEVRCNSYLLPVSFIRGTNEKLKIKQNFFFVWQSKFELTVCFL